MFLNLMKPGMLIGDPSKFAIESEIIKAYESEGQVGLGFFNIHILGKRYGVHEHDASMLACSYSEVVDRLRRRGEHVLSLDGRSDGYAIAERFLRANYGRHADREFLDEILAHHILWAPDGDAAFDDGSHIFHIDDGRNARLIGCVNGEQFEPQEFTELWLDGDIFYGVLSAWKDAFLEERRSRLHDQRYRN